LLIFIEPELGADMLQISQEKKHQNCQVRYGSAFVSKQGKLGISMLAGAVFGITSALK
jgi:hypothetical protein